MKDDHVHVLENLFVDEGRRAVRDVDDVHRKNVLENAHCDIRETFDDTVFVFGLLEVRWEDFVQQIAFAFFLLSLFGMQPEGRDSEALLENPEQFLVQLGLLFFLHLGDVLEGANVEWNRHIFLQQIHEFDPQS